MRLLLGSGGLATGERREAFLAAQRELVGEVSQVLFVPHALADHEGHLSRLASLGFGGGAEFVGLHASSDPVAAVREAEAISVGGGNTFRLLRALRGMELFGVIRERVAAGVPYIGVSAGTNVACPTMQTTNDMPIVDPGGFEALGLVPFQINAHYHSGRAWIRDGDRYVEHFGETRDERIREFHEENDTPVVGLFEGAWLAVVDGRVSLGGGAARLFLPGRSPVELREGVIDELTLET